MGNFPINQMIVKIINNRYMNNNSNMMRANNESNESSDLLENITQNISDLGFQQNNKSTPRHKKQKK